MDMSTVTLFLFALSFVVPSHAQSFGQTPIMGYNSYNQYSCSPNESSMRAVMDALSSGSFQAAGYHYFQIDCGWSARNGMRNATTGALAVDTTAFPSGLKSLADYARSKGFRWSMYSDAGVRMCDPQVPSPVLGSLGYESVDANFFASLGTEYLKCRSLPSCVDIANMLCSLDDNCYADGATAADNAPKDPRTDFPSRYGTMWNALQAVNIHGMLICQWGTPYSSNSGLEGPERWTKGIATSFRLSDDIAQGWSNVYRIYNQAFHIAASGLIGPGYFADADLLEVGNPGMTVDEQATHFAAWAMLKSALMISTDVTKLSSAAAQILKNTDLIAVNQDSLGKPVTLVQRWTGDRDLLAGPLANGDRAVLVVDLSNASRTLSVNFADLNITSANVKDLWTGTTQQGVSQYSRSVAAHGSLALRLSNIRSSSAPNTAFTYVSASSGTVAGGASVASCSGCSSGNKVGYIGGSSQGTLILSGIRTSKATQNVRFDYINCDVGYLGGGTNERSASISVNGGPAQVVAFPLSGYNWDKDVTKSYLVQLSGFNTNGANTIKISGVSGAYAPDLDRVGVVA